MSVQRLVAVVPASGIYSLATRSNFLLFVTATAAVNLRLESGGSAERFDGILGGLLVKRIKPWEETRVIAAPGVAIEALIGDELVDEDETDIRLQIATIAGVASFAEAPAATLTTVAQFAIAGGAFVVVAANLLRRRITICNDSGSGIRVWIRDNAAAVAGGVELQSGQSVQLNGTYSFRIFNDGAAPALISSNEES